MDTAGRKPERNAKGDGRRASSFGEVLECMARFRAGQVARLASRDTAAGGSLDRPGVEFSNPWADFADRQEPRSLHLAVIRLQPLALLAASIGATAAIVMLMGT